MNIIKPYSNEAFKLEEQIKGPKVIEKIEIADNIYKEPDIDSPLIANVEACVAKIKIGDIKGKMSNPIRTLPFCKLAVNAEPIETKIDIAGVVNSMITINKKTLLVGKSNETATIGAKMIKDKQLTIQCAKIFARIINENE